MSLKTKLDELEALADIGYQSKEIVPHRHEDSVCILGAAYCGQTGQIYDAVEDPLFYEYFKLSSCVAEAIMAGFDGDILELENLTEDEYIGYDWGKHVATKYLAATPINT